MKAKNKGNGTKEYIKEKVSDIVDGKLSANETEELIGFFKKALIHNFDQDDDHFFRDLTYELKGDVKELALMMIDFRKDLKSKIHPEITELATKYIPQAADQLESIIETTEMAANKIMDNLETLQADLEKMKGLLSAIKEGKMIVPGTKKENSETTIDNQTIQTISPLIHHIDVRIEDFMSLISDTFVQMSFQDLTGQRIKRIMSLVSQMEDKIKRMVISFGIQLTAKEKNPAITSEELQRAVEGKVLELSGPQKAGQGLDQGDIDALLANL